MSQTSLQKLSFSERLPSFSSRQLDLQSKSSNSPCSTINHSNSIKTTAIGIRTENETWNSNTDSQLTASLWETEFPLAEFEQQNEAFLQKLSNVKVSLRCANRSRANAKLDANRAESKLKISERVTEEKTEVKQVR